MIQISKKMMDIYQIEQNCSVQEKMLSSVSQLSMYRENNHLLETVRHAMEFYN